MFCAGCAATVERALRRIEGVDEVSVSFLSDSALVRHAPGAVAPDELARRLAALGYETRPLGEGGTRLSQGTFVREHGIRLAVAAFFGMWIMLATIARYFADLPDPSYAWWLALASGVLALPVFAISGARFFRLGWRGLRAGVPGMESLILVATVAAVGVSVHALATGSAHVWFEVPVMLIAFQLVARLGDFGARRRAADAVRSMLDLSPERAWLVAPAGHEEEGTPRSVTDAAPRRVEARSLAAGDLVESRPGERLAVDGRVVSGTGLVDAALLTGESLPVTVGPGDPVLAGTLNVDGTLRVRAEATGRERTLDRLAATVGRALGKKSDLMRAVDRVAGLLVPAIGAAAAIAFALALAAGEGPAEALARALATLVVSCPCALSLAVPLVVSGAASSAARVGVLLRDPAALEQADRIDTVLLDKTGTLTTGRLAVAALVPAPGRSEGELLGLAALAEAGSDHPLARAILRRAAERGVSPTAAEGTSGRTPSGVAVLERRERAGSGVVATLAGGGALLAGSARWLAEHGVDHGAVPVRDAARSRVLVALDGVAVGAVELADSPRADAPRLLESLRERGLRPVLASGDTPGAVAALADALGLEAHAALDPEAKRELVERLRGEGRRVAFVGDGLNDAPALAAADLGIATGGASDLARSAAALSVVEGGLGAVDAALRLAARAARTLRRNLVLASVYNAVLVPLALLGFVHPLMAVAAMAASVASVSLGSLPLALGGAGGAVGGAVDRTSDGGTDGGVVDGGAAARADDARAPA